MNKLNICKVVYVFILRDKKSCTISNVIIYFGIIGHFNDREDSPSIRMNRSKF